MEKFIQKLRDKPAHTRRVITAAVVFCVTGIIFLIWVTFWSTFSPVPQNTDNNQAAAPGSLVGDNWDSLVSTFSSGMGEIKNQFRF